MAEDTLVINSQFDPEGIVRGLDIATGVLEEFSAQIRQAGNALPAIDVDHITRVADATKKLNAEAARLPVHFEAGRQGGRRMESALTSMAIAGSGVTGVTARLVEGLVLFGAASLPLLEVAAALSVVTVLYNLLTKAQQDATKATEEHTKALQKLKEQQKGPLVQAQESFSAQRLEVERLSRALADVSRQRGDASRGLGGGRFGELGTQNTLLAEQSKLIKDVAAASDLLAVAQRALAEAQAAQVQRSHDLVASLALQAGTFGLTATQIERVRVEMDTKLEPADRKAALALLDYIDKLERQKRAHEEAIATARAMAQFNKQLEATYESLSAAALKMQFDFSDKVKKGWKDAQDAAEEYAKSLRDVADSLNGIEFVIVAEHAAKVSEEVSKIVKAISDLGGIAVDVGILSPEGNQAIQDFTKAGAALAQGDVFGAVVGGLHLVADALGKSAIDRERDAIMKENNLRLTELRLSLDRTNLGGGGLAKTQDVLRGRLILDTPQIFRGGPKGADELTAALAAAGLSLREFEILVKQQTNGIEILDSRGHLLAGAFALAREALAKLEKQMTTFGDTFPDVMQQMALGSRLRGEAQDPASQFQRVIDAFAKVGGPGGIGSQFTGLDLHSPAGREALRQRDLDLFNKISSGQLTGAELGGLTKEDWLKFLSDGADFLDQFNHGLNNATKSLLNVPTGFNLLAAEFRASAVGRVPYGSDGTSVPRANIDPGRTSSTVISGPVNIIIDGRGKDAAQLADEIQTELKRRSMATVGNPDAASFRRRLG